MKKVLGNILKILGIIIAVLCLFMFICILGKNTSLTTQISSIFFSLVAGYMILLLIVITLLSLFFLFRAIQKKDKLSKLSVILAVVSLSALIFGLVLNGTSRKVLYI